VRRFALIPVVAAAAILVGPAASASPGYSFGRAGGNIMPFTVTISAAGAVKVSGPVKVGRAHLTASRLASIDSAAVGLAWAQVPKMCPGTLPDIASTWIKVGTRTVSVHGSCSPVFTQAWNALTTAVRLSYG
jgi:hypothetical protein